MDKTSKNSISILYQNLSKYFLGGARPWTTLKTLRTFRVHEVAPWALFCSIMQLIYYCNLKKNFFGFYFSCCLGQSL